MNKEYSDASDRERFFELQSFAVVGNSDLKPFPRLTYRNLRRLGKQVTPVDMSGARYVEGDEAFASLADLPLQVEGVIVELPRHRVKEVVEDMTTTNLKHLWLHQGCDSPDVLQICKERGITVHWGSCAVMYTQHGFTLHSIHKLLAKLFGKY